MRLGASLGLLLPATCECAQIPEDAPVELGNRAIELKKLCPTLERTGAGERSADDAPRN